MATAEDVERYGATIRACIHAARLVSIFDVPGMLEAINNADTLGPIVDPTLWRRNHVKMYEDREFLEAALPLWKLAKQLESITAAFEGQNDGK